MQQKGLLLKQELIKNKNVKKYLTKLDINDICVIDYSKDKEGVLWDLLYF